MDETNHITVIYINRRSQRRYLRWKSVLTYLLTVQSFDKRFTLRIHGGQRPQQGTHLGHFGQYQAREMERRCMGAKHITRCFLAR